MGLNYMPLVSVTDDVEVQLDYADVEVGVDRLKMVVEVEVSLLIILFNMNIVCWNIRGFHQPHKQVAIRKLGETYKLDMIGIIENKARMKNYTKVFDKCF
ncbi:hypothetical protein ACH5RR_013450 [Cinchona calisaya]|uniref:Uncharacterized protein n=1 Tax=Cinchona calisaya TaxID=153742 RepID=A0ABD3A5T5_9GENT